MATIPTQIRIEKNVKEQASSILSELGMDISSAVNIFLRQCVLRKGLPFQVELPKYNKETLEAMNEARKISRDPNVPGYKNMEALKSDLDSGD